MMVMMFYYVFNFKKPLNATHFLCNMPVRINGVM